MATVFSWLTQSKVLQVIRHGTSTLFGRYLLLTNIGLSTCLSGAGDVLQQNYEMVKGDLDSWNQLRTRNMSIAGAAIGAMCHYWYLWLDRRLPGRTIKVVLKKVVVDQVFFSPVFISSFFIVMGILERESVDQVQREILEKGKRLYLAEWFIWPPAQVFNFYVLPTRYRVLYDNTISLGFDVYTSYLKNQVQITEATSHAADDGHQHTDDSPSP